MDLSCVWEAGERVPRPIFHRATHRAFYGNRIPSGKEKLSPPQTSTPKGERERVVGEGGGGGGGVPAIDPNVGGVLTIYTNNPGENLVQKFKTIRFDVVGERPAQSIPNSALQIE